MQLIETSDRYKKRLGERHEGFFEGARLRLGYVEDKPQ